MSAVELFVWGSVIHFVVDWLFQNEWIAYGKRSLRHPAGYVHAGMHAAALAIVFPPLAAAVLGVVHFVIDTRVPLRWWARIVNQPQEGVMAEVLHIWRDQALHIGTIAAAALIVAG